MSSSVSFSTLDVFTATPFKGNQLAVVHVTLAAPLSQRTKQAIAREFNFSETVFLHEQEAVSSEQRLDIFTTSEELPFAGHPTIGTICHICQSAEPPLESVKLRIKAGSILGRYDNDSCIAEAEMPHSIRVHQALVPRKAVITSQPALSEIAESLPSLPLVSITKGVSFVLVDLSSVSASLGKLRAERQTVDRDAIAQDEGWGPSFVGVYYFVIVSRFDDLTRIQCRMVEESIGEDPATGAAACTLASYLSLKGGKANQTYRYVLDQGVHMGRASEIRVKVGLDGSGKTVDSVILAGSAVLVTKGTVRLP